MKQKRRRNTRSWMVVNATGNTPGARKGSNSAAFSPEVTESIIDAVLHELAEKGYKGMAIDAVARRAGVGKSAIYRRWPSKEVMTVSVLTQLSVAALPELQDTGTFRGDLQLLMQDFVEWLSDPLLGRIYMDMVAEGQRNPELAKALSHEMDSPRRARAAPVIDRAIARGELSPQSDPDLILDLLGGTVFWRLIVRRQVVPQIYLDHVADLLTGSVGRS